MRALAALIVACMVALIAQTVRVLVPDAQIVVAVQGTATTPTLSDVLANRLAACATYANTIKGLPPAEWQKLGKLKGEAARKAVRDPNFAGVCVPYITAALVASQSWTGVSKVVLFEGSPDSLPNRIELLPTNQSALPTAAHPVTIEVCGFGLGFNRGDDAKLPALQLGANYLKRVKNTAPIKAVSALWSTRCLCGFLADAYVEKTLSEVLDVATTPVLAFVVSLLGFPAEFIRYSDARRLLEEKAREWVNASSQPFPLANLARAVASTRPDPPVPWPTRTGTPSSGSRSSTSRTCPATPCPGPSRSTTRRS